MIFNKDQDHFSVNYYYYTALILSIFLISTLVGTLSTWNWSDSLYEKHECDDELRVWVLFPTEYYSDQYDKCVDSSEVTGFEFSYFLGLVFILPFVVLSTFLFPAAEYRNSRLKVSRNIYYGTIAYLLFTIVCSLAAMFLFIVQADVFYSYLDSASYGGSSSYGGDGYLENPPMPNWFLINLLLMLPILLPWGCFAIAYLLID